MKKMQEMKVRKLMPIVVLMILMLGAGAGLATIFLTKPLASTSVLVTNANFNLYSDAGCTNIITSFDLGNVKRGDVITKLAWIKFTVAPEAPMKFSYDKGSTDASKITIQIKTMPSDMDVALNVQFGATHTTTTSIEPVKIIYTITNAPVLGEIITSTINWNANNPVT